MRLRMKCVKRSTKSKYIRGVGDVHKHSATLTSVFPGHPNNVSADFKFYGEAALKFEYDKNYTVEISE